MTAHSGLSRNIDYIPALHHLRCLAACLVLGHHYIHFYRFGWTPQPNLPWLAPIVEGHTGVGLFFALSGFLFTRIVLQSGRDVHYWGFVRNRCLRILPLYAFVFVLAISIKPDNLHGANIFDFLLSNLGSPVSGSFITGAAWTISIEFAFYLIFPFLIRPRQAEGDRYLLRLIGLLLVAKLGMFMAAERPDFAVYASLIGRMDQFLIGMLAASLAQRHHDRLAAHARWLLPLAAMATYGGLVVLARHGSMFGPPRQWLWLAWPTVEALLWSAVIVLYVVRPPAWPAWLDRLLQRGGEISYSLYMLHLLVIFILFRSLGLMPLTGLPWLDLALNAVPVALLTWTLAATSFAVIERPFLRMRGRYLD